MPYIQSLAAVTALATLTATPALAIDAEQLRRDLIKTVAEGSEGTLTIKDVAQRGSRLTLSGVVGSWKLTNKEGEPVRVVVSTDSIQLDRPSQEGDVLSAKSAQLSKLTIRSGAALITVPQFQIRDFTIPIGDSALNRLAWSADWRYAAMETGDIRIDFGDAWSGKIGKVLLTNADFVGPLPTRSYVQVDDIDLPIPASTPKNGPNPLRQLGYEKISADLIIRSRLDPEAETLMVDEMTYDVEDVGRLSMSLQVGQYDVARFQKAAASMGAAGTGDPSQLLGAMMAITVDGWEFSFEDRSIVDRVLEREAAKRGISKTKLADQLSGIVPFLLSQIGHPDFERQAGEAVTSFLKDPGRIALRSTPEHPVGVLQIAMAAQSAPATLVDLLALVIEASPH